MVTDKTEMVRIVVQMLLLREGETLTPELARERANGIVTVLLNLK